VSATGLLALGTIVRFVLAPDAADLRWQPAGSERAAETLTEVRGDLASALDQETKAARPLEPGEQIDLNTADLSDLRRLPGIGPARAAAIQRDRATRGPYGSVEDLVDIPGFGEGIVERLRPHVRQDPVGFSPPAFSGVGLLDLNRAQTHELEQITGIGPALAARIAAARAHNGGFRDLDELVEIPGIGPKTMQILRNESFVR
jgi:competence protein ComEA